MFGAPNITQWEDYGLGGVDDGQEPEDFRRYGLPNYGAYAEMLGIMSGEEVPLIAEVSQDLYGNRVLARTPMLELTPQDYKYIQVLKRPYQGMMALGDDGTLYEYEGTDGTLGWGFFKKIFKKAKSAVRKVARRVKGAATKILKKIPGGKYLLKLGSKIFKIANRLVKPLTKFVGKYAAKLAPVAALIPGYGPAIAAGLYTAGKIANLMNEYGVKLTGPAGAVRSLVFPGGNVAKKFKKALTKAAKRAVRQKKSRVGRRKISRGRKIRSVRRSRWA